MTTLGQALRGVFDVAAHNIVMKTAPRTHILLACMPKSGSTYLSNSIGRLPNFRKTSLVTHYGRTEQDIDMRLALRKCRYNYICQHHVRYNEKTKQALDQFNITPVVLVRNFYDSVISLRDHFRRESVDNAMSFVKDLHTELSDDELETFITEMAIPWYINFFVSWNECASALWVTYEEMISDEMAVVERMLRHAGHSELNETEIEHALKIRDKMADRVNVGQIGRGELLSEKNKATIRQYCEYYPDIDFSRVGISTS